MFPDEAAAGFSENSRMTDMYTFSTTIEDSAVDVIVDRMTIAETQFRITNDNQTSNRRENSQCKDTKPTFVVW
jgi:hypothetical protein